MIKKQQEFYDHYIKMSKTIDYGRINDNHRYTTAMPVIPMESYKYQSANLNPEVKNKSLGMERKRSYKPNSQAQKRLEAYSNSVERKEPFFPTIELN
jgi:hypothetical protein